jgi:hypothetical protein
MVDIEEVSEEKKELTLEQILSQFAERIQRLEATVGFIIHSLKIKPPPLVKDEAGVSEEEPSD